MAKILSVCNRLQAGDYEKGNGAREGKSTYSIYPRNASIYVRQLLNGIMGPCGFHGNPIGLEKDVIRLLHVKEM